MASPPSRSGGSARLFRPLSAAGAQELGQRCVQPTPSVRKCESRISKLHLSRSQRRFRKLWKFQMDSRRIGGGHSLRQTILHMRISLLSREKYRESSQIWGVAASDGPP